MCLAHLLSTASEARSASMRTAKALSRPLRRARGPGSIQRANRTARILSLRTKTMLTPARANLRVGCPCGWGWLGQTAPQTPRQGRSCNKNRDEDNFGFQHLPPCVDVVPPRAAIRSKIHWAAAPSQRREPIIVSPTVTTNTGQTITNGLSIIRCVL